MALNNPSGSSVAGNVATDLKVKSTQIKTLLYGHVELTTNATVANRRLVVSILDSSGIVIMHVHAGATVAASQTDQVFELLPGIFRETTFIGGALQVPVPNTFVIPPDYTLRIAIENGIAGDSYDYSLMFDVEHVVPGSTVI